MMVYIWLGILVLMVIVELLTTQLVTIWFAVGALVSFFLALFGVEQIWIQILAFLIVSAAALAVTRPLVRKTLKRKTEPTNADMVIGKTAIVTEKIDNIAGTGLVKVGGTVWSARTADQSVIEEAQEVEVQEIQGVKLMVTKKN